jgi:murein L,D-transpeptidase YafK
MSPRRKALIATCLLGAVACALGGLALAQPRKVTTPACASSQLRIYKAASSLELLCSGEVSRRFPATFGARPYGPKVQEGDERTPEGQYTLTSRLVTPRFHRFLGIDYPNAEDLKRSASLGITRPGRGIGIHGVDAKRASIARIWTRVAAATGLARLWGPTDGCIGLTNEDVEVVYDSVQTGTKVTIFP